MFQCSSSYNILIPFPTQWPITCEKCDNYYVKETSFKRDITRHAKLHSLVNPDVHFSCQHCSETFTGRGKATTHQATHFGDPNYHLESYKCVCKRLFATQKALSSHKLACKETPKNYDNVRGGTIIQSKYPESHNRVTASSPTQIQKDTNACDSTSNQPAPTLGAQSSINLEETEEANTFLLSNSNSTLQSGNESNFDSYCCDCSGACAEQDIDAMVSEIMPVKATKKRVHYEKKTVLSAKDLQALYSKSSKAAMEYIKGAKQVNCQVPASTLEMEMSKQFQKGAVPEAAHNISWPKCPEGIEQLSAPFDLGEVTKAIQHKKIQLQARMAGPTAF